MCESKRSMTQEVDATLPEKRKVCEFLRQYGLYYLYAFGFLGGMFAGVAIGLNSLN